MPLISKFLLLKLFESAGIFYFLLKFQYVNIHVKHHNHQQQNNNNYLLVF